MPIRWNATSPCALDQQKAAHVMRLDPAQVDERGGWTRAWRRSGRGPDRPFEPYGEEGLHLHLAVADGECGRRVLAVWEHELFVGHDHYFWRVDPFPWPDVGSAAGHATVDLRAALEGVDPFSPHIPDTCPAWHWTVEDVMEYRGLANRDSAYRWLNEQDIRVTSVRGVRWYDGRQVVLKAAAMPGRGKGGGRPRKPTPTE